MIIIESVRIANLWHHQRLMVYQKLEWFLINHISVNLLRHYFGLIFFQWRRDLVVFITSCSIKDSRNDCFDSLDLTFANCVACLSPIVRLLLADIENKGENITTSPTWGELHALIFFYIYTYVVNGNCFKFFCCFFHDFGVVGNAEDK